MTPGFDVLIVPGLGDSGPEHWQTRWQTLHGYARVQQRDWDSPELSDWLAALEHAIEVRQRKCVLVAHSLGCALVAHFAQHGALARQRVAAALLVAPADVDDPQRTPEATRGFAPLPLARLPFPARVLVSSNDPYVSLERAAYFAQSWAAEFENIGEAGHVNADSKLGEWEAGHERLLELIQAR